MVSIVRLYAKFHIWGKIYEFRLIFDACAQVSNGNIQIWKVRQKQLNNRLRHGILILLLFKSAANGEIKCRSLFCKILSENRSLHKSAPNLSKILD